MKIKILFFGKLAELSNKTQMDFTISKNNLNDVLKEIYIIFPFLENENFSIAVNKKLISSEYTFNENDEIAFMPPFSGG